MRIVSDPSELPAPNRRRGFVPTLGNLHRGHVSLIERAKELSDEVIVSLFVNPTQFRAGEDFERYPRTPEQDLAICEAAHVDAVFMPTRDVMYPAGEDAVTIHVGNVGDQWEGAFRPGHFDGVATVVANLFLSIKPHLAVFGQKDLQQNAVIRRMLAGVRMGVELHIAPTIREDDGLALSSRNSYLSASDREIAPQLYQSLCKAKAQLEKSASQDIRSTLDASLAGLDPGFKVQYFALVNRDTMDTDEQVGDRSSLIIAAVLGGTRLIDNLEIRK